MVNTSLLPDVEKYKKDVAELVKGKIVLDFSPGEYASAPVEITVDASASTGTFGSAVVGYKWWIDLQPVGESASIKQMYWAPGTHTLVVAVTDSAGNTQSELRLFTVDAPPSTRISWIISLSSGASTRRATP